MVCLRVEIRAAPVVNIVADKHAVRIRRRDVCQQRQISLVKSVGRRDASPRALRVLWVERIRVDTDRRRRDHLVAEMALNTFPVIGSQCGSIRWYGSSFQPAGWGMTANAEITDLGGILVCNGQTGQIQRVSLSWDIMLPLQLKAGSTDCSP